MLEKIKCGNDVRTPSKPGPEHGFLFRSSVSRLELYF